MTETTLARHLRIRSCPACHHLARRMAEHFAEIQGRLSRSEEARCDYADEGGYCPLHTWQLAEYSSPRGIARGHGTIIRGWAERLDRLADAGDGPKTVPPVGPDSCSICRFLEETETGYVGAFSAFLKQEGNLEKYERSHGLCLRHLRQVLARPVEEERKARILRLAAHRFREIGESMAQYDRKLEDLKRALLTDDEKDAYQRGLVMLAGARTVFSPFMKKI